MACVYALVVGGEHVYVGSTTNIAKRRRGHRSRMMNKTTSTHTELYEMCGGDVNGFEMIVLDDGEFDDIYELREVEEMWRKKLNPKLNRQRCYTGYKELMDKGMTWKEAYYELNKGEICKKTNAYQRENKDKKSVWQHTYHEKNIDHIHARKAEKIQCCVCGSLISRANMAAHKRTKKCMEKNICVK